MSAAFRCEVCNTDLPRWRIERRGDAVVSWSCNQHLAEICLRLQRDHEITELVVSDSVKRSEWAEIDQSLRRAAES